MEFTLPPLAPIDIGPSEYKDDLPPVLPRFFIPRLQEKPQDPIMDTLRIAQESKPSRPAPLPQLLGIMDTKLQECSDSSLEEGCALFWEHAMKKGVRVQVSQLLDHVKVAVVPNTEARVKSGHGIHCDHHSLESLLPVLFYLSSQVAPLLRLATSMLRQAVSGCLRLPRSPKR
jgi:hypothetical protein